MAIDANDPLYQDAAHLLRRAAFGAAPGDIQQAAQSGLDPATDRLVHYEQIPDIVDDDALMEKLTESLPDDVRSLGPSRLPVQLVKIWWTYRMLATQRPLQEKMVLFWHNHFTSADDGLAGTFLLRQNQLFRQHALGNFRELTLAISRDPEMLRYLNGNENFKAHPNENYGRELMELFTCGRVDSQGKPNYTEADVKTAARAFSGYNLRAGEFFFNARQHDNTAKTFLGQTGNMDGDDIVNILVALPATAYRICSKLFAYFAYTDPEPAVLNSLVKTYFASGYDIRAIVGQILRSAAFYSQKARYALIKQPAQLVVGTVRMAGLASALTPPIDQLVPANDTPTPLVPGGQAAPGASMNRPTRQGAMGRLAFLTIAMRSMGQDILNPPSVKGWDGGTFWINTDTMQARERFAAAVCAQPDLPVTQLAGESPQDAGALVDNLLLRFGLLPVAAPIRQMLVDYANSEPRPGQRARNVLSLIMGTPEYAVC